MTDQELNAAVAKKLGADPELGCCCFTRPACRHEGNNNFCTDIKAAWEIVASLQPRSYDFRLEWDIDYTIDQWMWFCRIAGKEASAETAQRAICLAFLKLREEKA